jgi:hypothetical protein
LGQINIFQLNSIHLIIAILLYITFFFNLNLRYPMCTVTLQDINSYFHYYKNIEKTPCKGNPMYYSTSINKTICIHISIWFEVINRYMETKPITRLILLQCESFFANDNYSFFWKFQINNIKYFCCLTSYHQDMEEPAWDLLLTRSISNIDNKSIMVTNNLIYFFVI